jgi:hypothetical protein
MSLTEPSSVWLNSTWWCVLFSPLERSRLSNLSIFISNGLTAVEHLDLGRLFRISVEIFS